MRPCSFLTNLLKQKWPDYRIIHPRHLLLPWATRQTELDPKPHPRHKFLKDEEEKWCHPRSRGINSLQTSKQTLLICLFRCVCTLLRSKTHFELPFILAECAALCESDTGEKSARASAAWSMEMLGLCKWALRKEDEKRKKEGGFASVAAFPVKKGQQEENGSYFSTFFFFLVLLWGSHMPLSMKVPSSSLLRLCTRQQHPKAFAAAAMHKKKRDVGKRRGPQRTLVGWEDLEGQGGKLTAFLLRELSGRTGRSWNNFSPLTPKFAVDGVKMMTFFILILLSLPQSWRRLMGRYYVRQKNLRGDSKSMLGTLISYHERFQLCPLKDSTICYLWYIGD